MSSPDPDWLRRALSDVIELARHAYLVEVAALKDVRYANRPRCEWDGGVDQRGRLVHPVWPRLAGAIAQAGAEPADFVRVQFTGRIDGGGSSRMVAPIACITPAALERYAFEATGVTDRTADRACIQIAYFETEKCVYEHGSGWTAERAARQAIAGVSGRKYDPIFQHCFARRLGATLVATAHHDAALARLTFVLPQYLQVPAWADTILTDELVREAELVRAALPNA